MTVTSIAKTVAFAGLLSAGASMAAGQSFDIQSITGAYFNVSTNALGNAYSLADVPRRFTVTSSLNARANPPTRITQARVRYSVKYGPHQTNLHAMTVRNTTAHNPNNHHVIPSQFTGTDFRGVAVQACNEVVEILRTRGMRESRIFATGLKTWVTLRAYGTITLSNGRTNDLTPSAERRVEINCRPHNPNRSNDTGARNHSGEGRILSMHIRTRPTDPVATGNCGIAAVVLVRTSKPNMSVTYDLMHGPGQRSVHTIRTNQNGRATGYHPYRAVNQSGLNQSYFYISPRDGGQSSNRESYSLDCSTTEAKSVQPQAKTIRNLRQNPATKRIRQRQLGQRLRLN